MQQARVDVAFSKMNTCAGGCDYLDEECFMIAPANILLASLHMVQKTIKCL